MCVVDQGGINAVVQGAGTHVQVVEATGGGAQHQLAALQCVSADQLGLALHCGRGDVAELGAGNRDHFVLAIHFHIFVENVVDRGGHQFDTAVAGLEHALDVARLPVPRQHFALIADDRGNRKIVARPVLVLHIAAENDKAAVLLGALGNCLGLFARHLKCNPLHVVAVPVKTKPGNRKFMEEQDVLGKARSLRHVDQVQHVVQVSAFAGTGILLIDRPHHRLHNAQANIVPGQRNRFVAAVLVYGNFSAAPCFRRQRAPRRAAARGRRQTRQCRAAQQTPAVDALPLRHAASSQGIRVEVAF